MFGVVAKATNLSNALKATTQIVPCISQSVLPPAGKVTKVTGGGPSSNDKCGEVSLLGNVSQPSIQTSLTAPLQVRYAHTDSLEVPNFDDFKKMSSREDSSSAQSEASRKNFNYLMGAGLALPIASAAKSYVTSVVSSIDLSKDVLAMAQSEFELDSIPEGNTVIMTWRSKPVFVRHRTAEEIASEAAVSLGELRDPQADSDRTVRPEWVIIIGVCTHLGCVPIGNAGQYGGWFCPCHGSHYDTSGRIRKGPAPLNLEVPPHSFPDDKVCVIG